MQLETFVEDFLSRVAVTLLTCSRFTVKIYGRSTPLTKHSLGLLWKIRLGSITSLILVYVVMGMLISV